jgi:transporter family-2 protein
LNAIWLIALAAAGGLATALQAHFMGILDKEGGTLESVFVTYAGGGAIISLVMLFQRGGNLAALASAPWYAYASGLLGLVIVGTLGYSAPRIGLVPVFTAFVSAQFLAAALFDHTGWLGGQARPLTGSAWAGMAALLLGAYLILRR